MGEDNLFLKGKRVILRPIKKADAQYIYEGARDRAISKYTFVPNPYTLKNAEEFIRQAWAGIRKGTSYNLGIELRNTSGIIGMIGVMDISEKHKRGEVGYWVNRKYWHQGYASEALELMLNFCFKKLKFRKVVAGVFPPNEISSLMLLRAGFKLEGRLRRHIKKDGRWMDLLRYGLLREEYFSGKTDKPG